MRFNPVDFGDLFLLLAVFLLLHHRGAPHDTRNALFLFGPGGAALCAALLGTWPGLVSRTRDTRLGWKDPALHACSTWNRTLTWLLAQCFVLIPYWITQVVRYEARLHDRHVVLDERDNCAPWERRQGRVPKHIWNLIKVLSRYSTFAYWGASAALVYLYFVAPTTGEAARRACLSSNMRAAAAAGLSESEAHDVFRLSDKDYTADLSGCTFSLDAPAPVVATCTSFQHHHEGAQLVWGFLVWHPWGLQVLFICAFLGLMGSFQYLIRPALAPWVFIVGAWSGAWLWFSRRETWGPTWLSLLSACLGLAFLVEPYILDFGHVLDESMLQNSDESKHLRATGKGGSGRSRKIKAFVFRMMWSRFDVQLTWLPWRDQVKEREELARAKAAFEARKAAKINEIVAGMAGASSATAASSAAKSGAAKDTVDELA